MSETAPPMLLTKSTWYQGDEKTCIALTIAQIVVHVIRQCFVVDVEEDDEMELMTRVLAVHGDRASAMTVPGFCDRWNDEPDELEQLGVWVTLKGTALPFKLWHQKFLATPDALLPKCMVFFAEQRCGLCALAAWKRDAVNGDELHAVMVTDPGSEGLMGLNSHGATFPFVFLVAPEDPRAFTNADDGQWTARPIYAAYCVFPELPKPRPPTRDGAPRFLDMSLGERVELLGGGSVDVLHGAAGAGGPEPQKGRLPDLLSNAEKFLARKYGRQRLTIRLQQMREAKADAAANGKSALAQDLAAIERFCYDWPFPDIKLQLQLEASVELLAAQPDSQEMRLARNVLNASVKSAVKLLDEGMGLDALQEVNLLPCSMCVAGSMCDTCEGAYVVAKFIAKCSGLRRMLFNSQLVWRQPEGKVEPACASTGSHVLYVPAVAAQGLFGVLPCGHRTNNLHERCPTCIEHFNTAEHPVNRKGADPEDLLAPVLFNMEALRWPQEESAKPDSGPLDEDQFWVAVDGPIACGKTTFIEGLGELPGVSVISEPVDLWEPILTELYEKLEKCGAGEEDPGDKLAGPAWQTEVHIGRHHAENSMLPRTVPRITERCYESKVVFAKVLFKHGLLTAAAYGAFIATYEEAALNPRNVPDIILKFNVPPHIAYMRVQRRGRKYEQRVTLDYLKELTDAYNYHYRDRTDVVEVVGDDTMGDIHLQVRETLETYLLERCPNHKQAKVRAFLACLPDLHRG